MIKQVVLRALHPARLAVNALSAFDFRFALRRYPSWQGRPAPWFTSSCVRWLVTLQLDGVRIMEYGGGNSTVWFAKSGAKVDCFERDQEWQAKILEMAGSAAVNIEFVEKFTATDYDIAVVDVHHRPNHLRDALAKTHPNGLVIFDDSAWYPKLFGTLRKYLAFHFWGFSAGYHGIKCTSVLVKNDHFTQTFENWENRTFSDDDEPLGYVP